MSHFIDFIPNEPDGPPCCDFMEKLDHVEHYIWNVKKLHPGVYKEAVVYEEGCPMDWSKVVKRISIA